MYHLIYNVCACNVGVNEMTVKELKEKLNEFPDDMEVWMRDHADGNDCPIGSLEINICPYDGCDPEGRSKAYNVLYVG
jgi:hypothetical protein